MKLVVLMKLVLHIFKKDTRRLWPAVVFSLSLVALLAELDRLGGVAGWLSLLLLLTGACLVGLAVLEEPLAGERQFWLTRPHRWFVLLAAKLLFAIVFVHLPLLLADSYVLAAHGFSPFACLPQMAGKQILVAASVTLPAMALAALMAGFTQFIMLLFAVAATTIAVAGFPLISPPDMMRPDESLRGVAVAGIAMIAAIAIVGLQYRLRRLAIARGVAILAVLLAGTLFGYVPLSFDTRLRAVLHPAPPLTLGIDNRKEDISPIMTMNHRETVGVPVVLSGVPPGAAIHIGLVDLTLSMPDGSRYRNNSTADAKTGEVRLLADVRRFPDDLPSAPVTLFLHFDPALYQKLKKQQVRAQGRLDVAFYRMGETTWMPMHGQVNAPGIGHCSSTLGEARWSEKTIEVLCESPSALPRTTYVTLGIPGIERQWHEMLGTRRGHFAGPHWTWLSTLNRAETFFSTADSRTLVYKFGLDVPLESLDRAKIGVTPEIVTGYTEVYFDLPGISLANYRVRPFSER